jgi:hypothetical protein
MKSFTSILLLLLGIAARAAPGAMPAPLRVKSQA